MIVHALVHCREYYEQTIEIRLLVDAEMCEFIERIKKAGMEGISYDAYASLERDFITAIKERNV